VSAPAVGQQIKELEDELGVELFERLARGVRLTPAGIAFLEGTRGVLGELKGVVDDAQQAGRGKVGMLRVGHVPMSSRRSLAGSAIPSFCMRYPHVEVRTMDMTTAEQYAALPDGRIDVGIVYAAPETSGPLRSELLDQIALEGVLLPVSHPLSRKARLHLSDLVTLPLLMVPPSASPNPHHTFLDPLLMVPPSASPNPHHTFLDDVRARGIDIHSDEEHQISDPAVRVRLVAAGAGWMPVTAASAEVLMTGVDGVIYKKWEDAPFHYPCCVVWRSGDRSAVVTNFVAFCRELRDGTSLPAERAVPHPKASPAKRSVSFGLRSKAFVLLCLGKELLYLG
jgi:LysR family transcriptional regulator, benzoate and cis,cis-muconate-responsive activator of ben and cat genes